MEDRAFASVAPHSWNRLSQSIQLSESVDIFKSKLKTHLMKGIFLSIFCVELFVCYIQTSALLLFRIRKMDDVLKIPLIFHIQCSIFLHALTMSGIYLILKHCKVDIHWKPYRNLGKLINLGIILQGIDGKSNFLKILLLCYSIISSWICFFPHIKPKSKYTRYTVMAMAWWQWGESLYMLPTPYHGLAVICPDCSSLMR